MLWRVLSIYDTNNSKNRNIELYDMEQKPQVRNKLKSKISSFSISKNDLYKLFLILQERSYASAALEIARIKKDDISSEDISQLEIIVKDGLVLMPTVTSIQGKEVWGNFKDIFNSPNFPDQIKSIYVNNEIPLKVTHNHEIGNSFEMFIDFSKPDLFNLSLLPSQETPNESNISIKGLDATWTHGVFSEINDFIKDHPSRYTFFHKHSIYDILLFIIGLPFGFWVSYKMSGLLNNIFTNASAFLLDGSYVYVFLMSLFVFRLLFHYARWVWPLVEFQSSSSKSIKHRLFIGTIFTSIISAVIYDLIKHVF